MKPQISQMGAEKKIIRPALAAVLLGVPLRSSRFGSCAVLLLVCLLNTFSAQAARYPLNLFIWSEYIDPAVVAAFEKQFDAKVTIDVYEDEAAMMAKLLGGGALYDVVVPPDHKVTALIKLNLLAPLRHDHIPNIAHLDDKFRNPPYDPSNRFTVAYQWGTVGLYARQPTRDPIPATWGILFDPKLQPGPFVLIDSPRDLIGAALKYRGYSLNSTDPGQLKEARDLLIAAKKRCLGFDGSVAGKNKVLSKTARAAIVYSGEAVRGMAEDKDTQYILPKEGSQIWQDNLAVLAKAPHRELAEKFINFILEPEMSARISNFTQFSTPNRAARAHIRPADLKNLAIYPSTETMARLEFLQDVGVNSRLYDEVWTAVKSK